MPTALQEFEKSLEALAAVAKDLGKAVCLEEREASKSRRKSLKAALKTLQDARTGPEAKQQLLVKLLATQVFKIQRHSTIDRGLTCLFCVEVQIDPYFYGMWLP